MPVANPAGSHPARPLACEGHLPEARPCPPASPLRVLPPFLGSLCGSTPSPPDWHQYDDIICKRPDGKLQEIKDYFLHHFTDQMKKNVRGKQLAASIMLDRVLSVLQSWSAVNLSSFFTQFRQFYSVVSEHMVYEEQAQPWTALNYPKEQVPARGAATPSSIF